jgi:predicted 3-demethylubiquinone-9 3-methyltransferase (glyoxalase superfamily)
MDRSPFQVADGSPRSREDTAMTRITPCLWFDTEGEEAAAFYVSLFKNSRINDVLRYGEAGPRPAGSVMVVSFELDGQPFTALNGGPEFTFNEALSLQIDCSSQDEVDHYWEGLSAGGEEGPCGWLKDRYGVSWQVVPSEVITLFHDPDAGRSQRAMAAMMTMKKIDVAAVKAAADGP